MAAAMQSQVAQLDAPIGGWNAFDSIDNMPATDAVVLDNLIPGAGTVESRQGFVTYVDTGEPGDVETIASVDLPGAEQKLLCAVNSKIIDVTDAENPSELYSGSSNDRWHTNTFLSSGGAGVSIWCNGEDDAQIYNGTSFSPIVDTSSIGADFSGSVNFKGRVYYWKEDSASFFYSQAGSFQGEIGEFSLSTFVQTGGTVKFATTWTQQDSGDGKDDFIVFVFTSGEVLVYQGDDPQAGGFWEMVGRYRTAQPLSNRGTGKFGADTIIMTKDGYVDLSTIVQQGRTSDVNQFSRLIYRAIKERTQIYGDSFGWECVLYQKEGLFLFNVPVGDTKREQHVLNTVTMRWCRFTNIDANCMTVHEEQLYAGSSDGKVILMLVGTSDGDDPIQFACLYAFNNFGAPGYNKHIVAAQVRSTIEDPTQISIEGYADYNLPEIVDAPFNPPDRPPGIWSSNPVPGVGGSNWDEAYWAGVERVFTSSGWQNVSAYGNAVSLYVRFARFNDPVIWRSTTVRFFVAGAQ